MSTACANLEPFLDGELDDAGATAFRRHLGLCERCPGALEATILADDLAEQVLVAGSGPRTVEIPGPSFTDEPPAHPGADRAPPDELARRRWSRRGLTLTMVSLGAAAAAAAVILVGGASHSPVDLLATLGQEDHRAIEGRLAYPGLDRHRPLARERGGAPATAARRWPEAREQTLAALEERGDEHGLALALLLEGRLQQAAAQLDRLARPSASAAVWSDQAALALERGDAPGALQLTDRVLAAQPGHPQALWNRAVALQMMGRRPAAAAAFSRVAALGEPGWADEARSRAALLQPASGAPTALPGSLPQPIQ
jgi:tetratricopeptide (TPR) repeat protein